MKADNKYSTMSRQVGFLNDPDLDDGCVGGNGDGCGGG